MRVKVTITKNYGLKTLRNSHGLAILALRL